MQAFVRSPEETLLSDAFGGIVSIGVTPGTTAGQSDALAEDESHQNALHPWAFCITTKVRSLKPEAKSRVDKALAASIEKGETLSVSAGTYRPSDYSSQTFEVVRALNHLACFCEQFKKREPFSLVGELPTGSGGVLNGKAKRRHEVFNDCDFVLGLLLFMISADKTNNDPLLWALLTTPSDEYQQQFEGTLAVTPSAQALSDQLSESRIYKLRLDGGVKPESLSSKMVQSGMSDRAFFSCDKFNAFLTATGSMEVMRSTVAAPRIRHWEYALSTAADLHRSCTLMGETYSSLSTAFRKSTRPNYWPFRKPDPETKKIALEPVGASLSRWMLRIANMCDSASANVQNTLTSDIVQDLVIQCLYNNALESSTIASEVALVCNTDHSLPARATHKVEAQLTNLLQYGDGGIDSLDKLEQIDDDISLLHDSVDDTTEVFKSHAEEVQRANRERLRQHLEEVVVHQKLQWDLYIMTMTDLQESLEDDEAFANLLDDELPIFAMNPTPTVVTPIVRPSSPTSVGSGRGAAASSSPTQLALQPVISPAMAATAKLSNSPTTVPKTGINNATTSSKFSLSSLLGSSNSKNTNNHSTFRRQHGSPTRGPAMFVGGGEVSLENPFDVPITMDDSIQGSEQQGTEMTELSNRPSWRQLYEHDRGGRGKIDDPFSRQE